MSDRLQREIEEILGKYKKFPLREPIWRRIRRRLSHWLSNASQWCTSHLPGITLGRVMLVGLAMIIVAYFIGFGSESITRSVIVAGLILFAAAFIFSLRRRSPNVEKRWRGQPLDIDEPRGSDRLRSWWGRWRSRRRTHR
ncbi:MAG: hypothetical protein ACUVV3_04535 [Dehalococcoidia bacterium]